MPTYHEVTATLDGDQDTLYGSYDRADCVAEIEAERESWKGEGYRSIQITSRHTDEPHDPAVYPDLITKKQLFMAQAPSFNFELDEDELLEAALDRGYVTPVEGSTDLYRLSGEALPAQESPVDCLGAHEHRFLLDEQLTCVEIHYRLDDGWHTSTHPEAVALYARLHLL